MRHSVEPNIYESNGFLSFAKNMGTNIGKNINKNLRVKYDQKLLDQAK